MDGWIESLAVVPSFNIDDGWIRLYNNGLPYKSERLHHPPPSTTHQSRTGMAYIESAGL